jgi:hypothetical protein
MATGGWEYGSVVAVQTGRPTCPIRVARVNGVLWNEGRIWDRDDGAISPDDMLNRLGADRWELVSTVVALDGLDDGAASAPPTHVGRTFIYYLKRPRL